MTEKDMNSQVEVAPRRGKRHSCARHCKRFWWLYLIVFICIVVLVVCLVIFVGIPHIAQSKINSSTLEIQGVNILKTESNEYLMEINSTITTDGSISATIDPFEGEMYLEDLEPHTAFASVNFPATNGNSHQVINISQAMTIKDMDAFTTFNVWFFQNETVRVTVNGNTKVKPSGLDHKYNVQFQKTLTINGLNMLKGTTLPAETAHITTDPKVKQNFNGTSVIPNQSVFTLDLGNATFTNYLNDKNIGTLSIDNFTLKPGNNTVAVTASLNQGDILVALTSKEYCKNGIIPFELQGASVTNNGQNLTYFATALASGNQTVEVDIGQIIKEAEGFTPSCA